MLEIEFKTLLSEEDYLKLTKKYQTSQTSSFVQSNYYFDTAGFDLKKEKCGLRIRTLPDSAELTLKSPAPVGLKETTDKLTLKQAADYLKKEKIPKTGNVAKKINAFNIPLEDLKLIASLTTERFEKQLDANHLLVLDKSWNSDFSDYELEMEVNNYDQGLSFFKDFLVKNQIPYQQAQNKISRTLAHSQRK